MAENATLFMVYGELQNVIRRVYKQPLSDQPTLPQLALAAAGAGAVTSFVLCATFRPSLCIALIRSSVI